LNRFVILVAETARKLPTHLKRSANDNLISLAVCGRIASGLSLVNTDAHSQKDSKTVIESIVSKDGLSGSPGTGCLSVILVALVRPFSGYTLR
jgi:hypothetical protein